MVVILLLTAAGCGEERPRPAPLDPTEGPLQATITEPTANDTVEAGVSVRVEVAGQDPLLRSLVGLGLVVRQIDNAQFLTLDSSVIRFTARAANSAQFDYDIPASLPIGAVVNVYGIALGSSGRAHESNPRSFFVQDCSDATCD